MSEALKTHIINSLSILDGSDFEAPSSEIDFKNWLNNQIKTKGTVITSILKSAIRKGIV